MFFLNFSLRRIIRHWRINALVFLGLVLTGALVAGLPAYAQVIAAEGLDRNLALEPSFSRNILLTAPPSVTSFNATLQGIVDDELGFLVLDRVEVRDTKIVAYPSFTGAPMPGVGAVPLYLWSFSSLTQDTTLVEGDFPDHLPPSQSASAMFDPQPVEVAIGSQAARDNGVGVGDVFFDPQDSFEFRVVGIVEPLNAEDERWWGDRRPFELEVILGQNEDVITMSFLINPISMANYFQQSTRSWRLIIDQDTLNPQNFVQIQDGIVNTQAGFEIYGVEITSGIPQLLNEYQSQLAIARVSLLLLTSQALIFVFYTLGMVTSFMLDRSQSELATLASRGARRSQMIALFTIEGFILTVPAASLLGPPLMKAILTPWVNATGYQINTEIPVDAWLLSLSAALVGWISFVLPGIAASGKSVLEWQQSRARPPSRAVWQARNFDIFLFIVSALAFWQLVQSGSFVMTRFGDTALADPLLLLGPSLLLIAVALLFLRFFPYLLRAIYAYYRQGRGLVLPVGLARLARDPVGPSRVVLLISLAATLTLFSITFRDSIDLRQAEMAHYVSGADLRVMTNRVPLSEISRLEGVTTTSPAFRMRLPGPNGRFVTLLAVDTATIGNVTSYPEGIGLVIEDVIRTLEAATPTGKPAAILSGSALSPGMALGEVFTLQFSQNFADFELRGIIEDFPTLEGAFILIDFRALDYWTELTGFFIAQGEAWLNVEPAHHAVVVENFPRRGEVLGDTQAQLQAFRANALSEGGKRAFALNAAVLGVLSVAGFIFVHYFTAQQRLREFGVLRAGGLSSLQLLWLLIVEGILVMGLGLASGTVIGLGLTFVMRPFLSRVFSSVMAGAVVERIVIDWAAIGQMFGLLAALYLLALLISVIALLRVGVHKVLRMSAE